jgi:hypothetical protein
LLTFVLVIGLLMPALAGNRAAAEDATPVASVLANLGYPELRLVVTDEGPEAPTEASAGRHLIVLENHGSPDGPAALSDVNLLRLPEGVTLDDLNALLASSAGTVPDWFHQIDSAGGFYVAAGGTGYAVLDLEAGEWYIGIGDSNPYSLLTVTDAPIASPIPAIDPPADLEIEMVEFELGLPATLPAGQQVWHATNAGSQQHEMVLVRTPVEMTVESVITVLTLPEGEPVPAGLPDPSTIEFLTEGLKTMSPGREIWIELDLSPGNYAAYCGSPDIERGQPHALIGEAHVFTVQ